MTTIAKGNTAQIYAPIDTSITFTPGSGGSIEFGCSSPEGSVKPEDRVIYTETSISIPAGSEVVAQAVRADATYSVTASALTYNPATGLPSGESGDVILAASGVAGAYRITRATMAGWVKARAKALGGQRGLVLWAGDSTTCGAGAGSNAAGTTRLTGARTKNHLTRLASMLTARGVAASNDHLWGDGLVTGDTGVTYQAYDPRMGSYTGTVSTSINTIGGKMFLMNAVSSKIAFTPASTFDTITVYYVRSGSNGTFTVDVDGGAALATINTNGVGAVMTQAISCSRGTHTVNFTQTVTGACYIIGATFTDSTSGAVDFIQAGAWGTTSSYLTTIAQPWEPLNLIGSVAPDHTFYELTINDSNTLVSPATYEANVRLFADKVLASGSGLTFVAGYPFNPSTQAIRDNQAAIRARMQSIAESYGVGLIDTIGRWGAHPSDTGGTSTAQATWYSDFAHPTQLGYGDRAAWVAEILSRV